MQEVSLIMAFVAGTVSFLSPCVLPLVPGYLSFVSGMSFDELAMAHGKPALVKRAQPDYRIHAKDIDTTGAKVRTKVLFFN